MEIIAQVSTESTSLATLDHIVIGVYLLCMMSMGLYIAKKQTSTEDFFLAGRNLPSWAVGISLMASLLSTITYLSTPGEIFRTGPSYLLRIMGIPLVLVCVFYIWVPFFMRLRLTSAYEYLERRFNYATRVIAALFCLLLLLGWMATVVLTASKGMSEIVKLDLKWFLGVNDPGTQTTDDGGAIFVDADLLEADQLADQLTSAQPASKTIAHLQGLLTAEEKEALASNSERAQQTRDILNRLLTDPQLYDKSSWAEVVLNDAASKFTKTDLSLLKPNELSHFNRALLESLFTTEIAASRPAYPDADMHAIIISIGLFSVLYTTMGGMRAVVWTDVIQFIVLVFGAFLTIITVAWTTGSGVTDWFNIVSKEQYETVEWFTFDVGTRSTVFTIICGMFFWSFCTHSSNQVALQRYFSVRNVREGRKSYLINACCDVGLALLLGCVGMSLFYFVHDAQSMSQIPASEGINSAVESIRNESQDKIFPQFIRIVLPTGIRGLVVAALFAAAMSTIDSGANSISTIVTVDFYRKLSGHKATAKGELRLARMLTATMGVVIVLTTLFLYHFSKGTDLLTLCQKGFNCFLGPLGGIFCLGIFAPLVSSRAVIPAMFVGEAVGICSSYSKELFDVSFSTHLVVAAGWLATIVAAHLFAILLNDRPTEEQKRWLFVPIMQQKVPEIDEIQPTEN